MGTIHKLFILATYTYTAYYKLLMFWQCLINVKFILLIMTINREVLNMEYLIETMKFSKEFILHPISTSSIVPSSKNLSCAIVSVSNIKEAKAIIELGCGTGAVTEAIVKNADKNSNIFSFDTNSAFIKIIREKYPQVRAINDSAENMKQYMNEYSVEYADTVISSLPWATFSIRLQIRLINTINCILNDNGEFVTYAYLHTKLFSSHKRFVKILHKKFKTVTFSSVVWTNLPPAFIIKCKKD